MKAARRPESKEACQIIARVAGLLTVEANAGGVDPAIATEACRLLADAHSLVIASTVVRCGEVRS